MIARYSSLLVVLCLITAAVGPVASAAAQQSQASASGDWVMPRTPDGHPDFQGTWTNVTITPFERPRSRTVRFSVGRRSRNDRIGRWPGS